MYDTNIRQYFIQEKALVRVIVKLHEGSFEALAVTAANVTELHLGAGLGTVGMQD